MNVIAGTTVDVDEIFCDEQDIAEYIAQVIHVDEYGFYEIEFVTSDKKNIKRHVSDISGIDVTLIYGNIKGLINIDGTIHICKPDHFDVAYVICTEVDGQLMYYPRIGKALTTNITEAWFTFNQEQAQHFAAIESIEQRCGFITIAADTKISIVNMCEV